MTALLGTFVNVKTMADGTPRIVLDMQCTLSEIAAMGLVPGVPFGLARIEKEAAVTPEPKEKPGPLCIMACKFCDDHVFWSWIKFEQGVTCTSSEGAKEFVLDICNINTRKELDSNPVAAGRFHERIRAPFVKWRDNKP